MGNRRRRNNRKQIKVARSNSSSTQANVHNNQKELSLTSCSYIEGIEKVHYLEGLVTKQLELYTWCEEKVTTLATIDSILLAGATLFVEHIKSSDFPKRMGTTLLVHLQILIERNFPVIMVLLIILPIFISLGITLWHVIPKMRSGASPSTVRNHRSSVGIHKYKKLVEYENRINEISINEICKDLIRQVYGMNEIIWKNQISIKVAVIFDLVGLTGFFFIMLYLVFNGNGSVIFS